MMQSFFSFTAPRGVYQWNISITFFGRPGCFAMLGVLARPAARYGALSPMVQNNLVQGQSGNQIQALLSDPRLQQLIYRTAPVAGADR